MSFGKNFKITCDWCERQKLDTGESDTSSCNELAKVAGWKPFRSNVEKSGKWLHLCRDCKDSCQ